MADARDDEKWLQRLIAGALMMGIGKRELLEDYYYDELGPLIDAWSELHRTDGGGCESVEPMSFLGEGGEWID